MGMIFIGTCDSIDRTACGEYHQKRAIDSNSLVDCLDFDQGNLWLQDFVNSQPKIKSESK